MTVYALNGLGRMGKLALKPLLERGAEIAWIDKAVGLRPVPAPAAERGDLFHERGSEVTHGTARFRWQGSGPLRRRDPQETCVGEAFQCTVAQKSRRGLPEDQGAQALPVARCRP